MTKSRLKDALILFLITVIAGIGLGAVYSITKAPIAQANYNKTQNSYKAVITDASKFTDLPGFSESEAAKVTADGGITSSEVSITNCVQGVDSSGNLVGYVMTIVTHEGYGGDITFSLGYKTDGTITGYSTITNNETAGLGQKAKEPAFADQFANKKVDEFTVTKTGATKDNEIDAISGATITSRAMTKGVNAGIIYGKYLVKQTGGKVQS